MNSTISGLRVRLRLGFFISLAALLVVSCTTGRVLHREFGSVNIAYAEALNEQMLLNIARLDNGHPAYYLAIGTIHNKLSFSSDTTASGSHFTDTRNSSPDVFSQIGLGMNRAIDLLFGTGFQEKLSGSTTPEFQFIPLNNEDVAQQVLKPIPTDVFTALYLQGFPIDQLMRVLIERVETTLPNGHELVLINSPTRTTPENYARFLRACWILRELQRQGDLLLETRMRVQKIAAGVGGENENTLAKMQSRNSKAVNGTGSGSHPDSPPPSGGESREVIVPTFYLRSSQITNILAHFATNKFDISAVSNVIALLTNGITIKTDLESHGQGMTRLVLRSFDRATEAAASEQDAFVEVAKNKEFQEVNVPYLEQRPILKTLWTNADERLEPALVKVHYAGKTYQVTDPAMNPLDPAARWNRNAFRLLVVLSSQVTVDISRYQRQIIELQ